MGLSKIILSGSTHGKGIKVTGVTGAQANTIHTAISGTGANLDEVWLYAVNMATTNQSVVVLFGGTGSPDDEVEFTLPTRDGMYLMVPGLPLRNAGVVKAYSGSANVVMLHGYVHRNN